MADNVFGSINVMVVEDQELAQRVVARILEDMGVASVAVTANGVEAIDRLKQSDPKIDLIICDIEMPEIGGYEFVRKIRYGAVPERNDTPILMLTGEDSAENVTKGTYHRIDGFIVKPPTAKVLRGHMLRALGISPPA